VILSRDQPQDQPRAGDLILANHRVFEQDRRVIELNAVLLAKAARAFNIPVVLSTVGVEMGVNTPTIASLRDALPALKDIDRSSTDAWEDPAFVSAVKATGRKRLVIGGIVTSVCLAYAVVEALANGFEVCFVEDAVGDTYKDNHDIAVRRIIQAGAVPNSTQAMFIEWYRDWKSPFASSARELLPPYVSALTALKKAPQFREAPGVVPQQV
jgi:nicotinamidase-related amidase